MLQYAPQTAVYERSAQRLLPPGRFTCIDLPQKADAFHNDLTRQLRHFLRRFLCSLVEPCQREIQVAGHDKRAEILQFLPVFWIEPRKKVIEKIVVQNTADPLTIGNVAVRSQQHLADIGVIQHKAVEIRQKRIRVDLGISGVKAAHFGQAIRHLVLQLLQKIGILALYNHLTGSELEYFTLINTQGAVVLGMVYNYLPFMILPIYSVIVKLDHSLIEAARDLGANSVQVFRRVILPLSLPGVLSGITMVFVPSVSTFAISKMLGGGTEMLLGDLIEQQYMGGAYNPYLGAAISLVMMVIVVICMVVMNRFGEGEEQAVMM